MSVLTLSINAVLAGMQLLLVIVYELFIFELLLDQRDLCLLLPLNHNVIDYSLSEPVLQTIYCSRVYVPTIVHPPAAQYWTPKLQPISHKERHHFMVYSTKGCRFF